MTIIDRRRFLTSSVAGVSTAFLAPACSGPDAAHADVLAQIPASGGGPVLYVTIRGLCVFVLRKDGLVDVALLSHENRKQISNVDPVNPVEMHQHAARLLAATDAVIANAEGTPASSK